MNCFECAKTHDTVPAIGVCQHCTVGLCFAHLVEAHDYRVGGTTFGCPHVLPHVKPLSGVPVGITAASRRHTAGVA